MPPTLFINAGGQSRRMGQPKALLRTPQERPLIQLVVDRLRPLAADVLVVANDPAICAAVGPSTRCLPDTYPDCGPLGGLATALAQVEDWIICVGCDMPFLNPDLFAWLLERTDDVDAPHAPRWDAIVPHAHGRPQPLHALYHPRCLPAILKQLDGGHRRMDSFLADVNVLRIDEVDIRRLDPDLDSFANANTEEEWQAILPRVG